MVCLSSPSDNSLPLLSPPPLPPEPVPAGAPVQALLVPDEEEVPAAAERPAGGVGAALRPVPALGGLFGRRQGPGQGIARVQGLHEASHPVLEVRWRTYEIIFWLARGSGFLPLRTRCSSLVEWRPFLRNTGSNSPVTHSKTISFYHGTRMSYSHWLSREEAN